MLVYMESCIVCHTLRELTDPESMDRFNLIII